MTTVVYPWSNYRVKAVAYTVPSGSKPGTVYTVQVDPYTGLMECSCPAARMRRAFCRHQRAVVDGAAGKPRMRVQVRPAPTHRAP